MSGFYSEAELLNFGFRKLGKDVLISRKTSIYGAKNISLGNHIRIDDFAVLSGNIKVGDYAHIGVYSALFGGEEGIEMEDFVSISANVTIWSKSDDYSGEALANPTIPEKFKKINDKKVLLKKYSMLASGVTVLPGVTIEEGVAIGAMSLVTKSTEPWNIYFGVPAKFYKQRKKELIKKAEQMLIENISAVR